MRYLNDCSERHICTHGVYLYHLFYVWGATRRRIFTNVTHTKSEHGGFYYTYFKAMTIIYNIVLY